MSEVNHQQETRRLCRTHHTHVRQMNSFFVAVFIVLSAASGTAFRPSSQSSVVPPVGALGAWKEAQELRIELQENLSSLENWLDVSESHDDSSLATLVTESPSIIEKKEDTRTARSRELIASSLLSSVSLVCLGTYAATVLMDELLVRYEFMQSWRYLWPCIGALYVLQAIQQQSSSAVENSRLLRLLPFAVNAPWWNLATAVCGIGLLIGGAYDAFMPVWMTGPNVFTDAGIGHDSAAALLVLSMFGITRRDCTAVDELESLSATRMIQQVILLSQLCILGEGTISAVLSDVSSIISVS